MYGPNGRKSMERALAAISGTWVERQRDDFTYDTNGQLRRITHPDGTFVEYAYDPEGRVATIQDENHTTPNTNYFHDSGGRLSQVRQLLKSTPETWATTAYAYDVNGNRTSVTDPNGNVTVYLYDDFGNMLRQQSPVTGLTSYGYDEAGNLLTSTDANGATTTRQYDALNRVSAVTSTSNGGTESVTWNYDIAVPGAYSVGRLVSSSDPTGTTSYRYDRRGLTTSEQKSIDGTIYTTAFAYDADGNRNSMRYPSGRTATFGFDYAGRPVSLQAGTTPIVTSAQYLPFGPLAQVVFGNGTTRSMGFNSRYLPTSNQLIGPTALIANYSYGTDPNGNITAIHDLLNPTFNRDFGYDGLNRLTTANSGSSLWGAGTYSYDAMGNMSSLALGSLRNAQFAYAGTTPKLTSVTENGAPRPVTYDAAGNESQVGSSVSAFTPTNHLESSDGISYGYDGRGIRVRTSYPEWFLASLDFAPLNVPSGSTTTGTVTLAAPAPQGGVAIPLVSSDAAVLTVPTAVTVPAGQVSATFAATSSQVSTATRATITATSVYARTVTVTIVPVQAITVSSVSPSPAVIYPGIISHVTVTMSAIAPEGGAALSVSASNQSVIIAPATLTVPAGSSTAAFDVTVGSVTAATDVTLSVSYGTSTATTVITVRPVTLGAMAFTPSPVVAPASTTGTVSLNGVAPAAGLTVSLASSIPTVAAVPATVAMPAGSTSVNFTITTTSQSSPADVVITATLNGSSVFATLTVLPCTPVQSPQPVFPSGETIWVDDALPQVPHCRTDPTVRCIGTTASGPAARASLVNSVRTTPSRFETYIIGLSEPLQIGESLVAYFRVNECAVPQEIGLWWDTNGGSANVYWGQKLLGSEQRSMGAVPATGGWIRLEIPLSQLGLEQRTLTRIRLVHYGGQVWFDHLGKVGAACVEALQPPPTIPSGETVWVDDALPAGATLQNGSNGPMHWDTSQRASGASSLVNSYNGSNTRFETYITGLSQPLQIGESVVAYFRVNACARPQEIGLWWDTNGGSANVYWGQKLLGGEQRSMGPVPTTGEWVRVEIPLSQLGLEQRTLTRIRLVHYGGQVWFDHLGKTGAACVESLQPPPAIPPGETVWVDDALPSGATLQNGSNGPMHWDTSQRASGAASLVNSFAGSTTRFETYITGLSQPLQIGESVVAYFRVNACARPQEIGLWWDTNGGSANVYWGQALPGRRTTLDGSGAGERRLGARRDPSLTVGTRTADAHAHPAGSLRRSGVVRPPRQIGNGVCGDHRAAAGHSAG